MGSKVHPNLRQFIENTNFGINPKGAVWTHEDIVELVENYVAHFYMQSGQYVVLNDPLKILLRIDTGLKTVLIKDLPVLLRYLLEDSTAHKDMMVFLDIQKSLLSLKEVMDKKDETANKLADLWNTLLDARMTIWRHIMKDDLVGTMGFTNQMKFF